MPVDYAEPTKLQDFQVEVFQPGSDTPTLTKPTNSSTHETAPGQLTVPNRDTGLGKPNNLPERQNSLRNDGQYRTVDVTPTNTAKPAPKKQNNQLTTGNAGDAATYEAAYYAGLFIGGVISGALNNTPQSDSIKDAITPEELATTEGGYETGQELRRTVKEAVENGEKLLDNFWRNKPTFEIPQIKIPKFDLPELPDLEPPKFPDFKFPEISFPKPQPVSIPQLKQEIPTESIEDVPLTDCGIVTFLVAISYRRDSAFSSLKRCSNNEALEVLRKNNPFFATFSDQKILSEHNFNNGTGVYKFFSKGICSPAIELYTATNNNEYPTYRTYTAGVQGSGKTIREIKNQLTEVENYFAEVPDFISIDNYGIGISSDQKIGCAIPKFTPNPSYHRHHQRMIVAVWDVVLNLQKLTTD